MSPFSAWEVVANAHGVDLSTLKKSVRSRIRHRAEEMGSFKSAPVNSDGVADFSSATTKIIGRDGKDHGMSVNVPETLDLVYGSHFQHLDAKFLRPGTHVWDHLPVDGHFQLVERIVHANTQHKGYELWTLKKG
jgi:hypothetical protein